MRTKMRLTGKKSELMALDALMCLFVVFIHASSAVVSQLDRQSAYYALVYLPWRLLAINVPGFLFLGGLRMYLNKPGRRDYKRFYITRLTRVLLPYLIATLVYYLYFVDIGYMSFSVPDLLRYMLDGSISAPFYFVVVIVQLYALVPLWDYVVRRLDALPALLFAMLLTFLCRTYLTDIIELISPGAQFMYSDRIFASYLFFWLAGCYAGRNYDAFTKLLKRSRAFITATFVFSAVLEAVFSYIRYRDALILPFLETVHYMYCVSAVFFLYMLVLLFYEKRELTNRLVLAISGASYRIYLTHSLVIVYISRFMTEHGFFGPMRRYAASLPAVFVITVTLCVLYGVVKRRLLGLLPRGRRRPRPRRRERIHK